MRRDRDYRGVSTLDNAQTYLTNEKIARRASFDFYRTRRDNGKSVRNKSGLDASKVETRSEFVINLLIELQMRS